MYCRAKKASYGLGSKLLNKGILDRLCRVLIKGLLGCFLRVLTMAHI